MSEGFIILSRKLFEHWTWQDDEPMSRGQAWASMINAARYKDGESSRVINGRVIRIKKGELIGSVRYLQNMFRWGSKGKVVRFLDLLENDKMIGRRTVHSITVIKLLNFDKYSDFTQYQKEGRDADRYADGYTDGTQAGQGRDRGGTQAGQNSTTVNTVNTDKKNSRSVEGDPLSFSQKYPTFEQVKMFAFQWAKNHRKNADQAEQVALKFFGTYSGNGWRTGSGQKITNWQDLLVYTWLMKDCTEPAPASIESDAIAAWRHIVSRYHWPERYRTEEARKRFLEVAKRSRMWRTQDHEAWITYKQAKTLFDQEGIPCEEN